MDMKKTDKERIFLRISALVLAVLLLFASTPAFAESSYYLDRAVSDGSFVRLSSYSSYSAAYKAFKASNEENAVIRNSSGKVVAMKRGMAIALGTYTVTFDNAYDGNISGYVAKYSVCYYLSTDASQNVTVYISGMKGTASISYFTLVPYCQMYPNATGSLKGDYQMDYFANVNNELVHYISVYTGSGYTEFYALTLDKAPEFMEKNVRYYSIDQHTFYGSFENAVSGTAPVGSFYAYYKYLSFRTETIYTESQLNSYIAYKNSTINTGYRCVYLGLGGAFLSAQNTYGANAMLEIAFANVESGYGKSYIARYKNNIFSVNAVDSSAASSADTYASASDAISQHAKYTLSRGYFDAYFYYDPAKGVSYYNVPDRAPSWVSDYTGDSRYFGTCLGSKSVGINVKYASDPWHGDKIASMAYGLDKYLGGSDYGRYTLGVTNKVTFAYSEPSTGSWKLYKYSSRDPNRSKNLLSNGPAGMNLVILGEEGDFYKIQSDIPVNGDKRGCNSWDYSFATSTAYVLKEDVDIVRTFPGSPLYGQDTPPSGGGTGVTDPETPIPSGSGNNGEDPNTGETPAGSGNQSSGGIVEDIALDEENKFMTGVNERTEIQDILTHFIDKTAAVFSNGTEVTEGFAATGMTVKLTDNETGEEDTYTIIVKGDTSGDGKVTSTDVVLLMRSIVGIEELSAPAAAAADVNKDSKHSSTDAVLMRRYIVGLEESL